MPTSLKNVSLRDCRKVLQNEGCKLIRTSGGHEVYSRTDLLRPLILQNHIDPVPERIIRQILRGLDMDREEFGEAMKRC